MSDWTPNWKFSDPEHDARVKAVEAAFDRDALKRVCEMSEADFATAYDMVTTEVAQEAPSNFFHFRDNGSSLLAVAHLDTVADTDTRTCNFLDTEGGPVVYSRALDDRLGAYVLLELLPALGIVHDVLLTVGEEEGRSTALYFDAPKDYNWMIEFDRGGTDVVMYQYEDDDSYALVRDSGARMGSGSFTDICYLEHLGRKGFNWGVGYRDYHGPRSHAYLDDTFAMVARFLKFREANEDKVMEHVPTVSSWSSLWGSDDGWEDEDDDNDAFAEYAGLLSDEFDDDEIIDNPTSEQLAALDRALERGSSTQ